MSTKIQKLTTIISPDPSLVLDLDFDTISGNTIRDRSRYNNHGTIYGATPGSENGKGNIILDGIDDYCTLYNTTYNWTTEDWSIITIAKLNPSATTNYRGIISNRFGEGQANWFTLGTPNLDVISLEITNGSRFDTTFNPKNNPETNYILTKKGTIIKIYINAILIGTYDIITTNIGDETNELKIGNWFTSNQCWQGPISKTTIFTRTLTPQEIKKNYLQTTR